MVAVPNCFLVVAEVMGLFMGGQYSVSACSRTERISPKALAGSTALPRFTTKRPARVGPASSVAIGEENICVPLLVMCAGQDVVGRQRGRTQKLGVNGQGADGQSIAVDAQVVKLEVGRNEGIHSK